MEPTTIILLLALLFGGVEHIQKEAAQDQVVELETQLQEAHQTIQTVKEVNETNASTIDQITAANSQCVEILEETKQRQAGYIEANRISQVRIETLENIVDSFEWSAQPIPLELIDQLKD